MIYSDGLYYKQQVSKDLIVLHHTVAYNGKSVVEYLARESMRTLGLPNPYTVGVAYVVNFDGTIYQAFDDSYWSFHSGLSGASGIDPRSVAIEVDNLGGLTEYNGQLYDAYKQVFGKYEKDSLAYDNKTVWRGYRFYEKYYNKQVDALIELCESIIVKHNIPRLIPADFFPESNYPLNKIMKMKGIATHTHFLPGKYKQDLSVAFKEHIERFKKELRLEEYNIMDL